MVTPVKSNQQHIFIHDAICEGPIDGLLYGESSIFLNGNRVKDLDPDAPWTPTEGKIKFTSSNDLTGAVTFPNIPSNFSGTPKNDNFLVLRDEGITKSSAQYNSNGTITITGSTNFSDYHVTAKESATLTGIYYNGSGTFTTSVASSGSGYTSAPGVVIKRRTSASPLTYEVITSITATTTVSNGSVTGVTFSSGTPDAGNYIFEVETPTDITNRFIVLANPNTNEVMSVGEGKVSGTSLIFIPYIKHYNDRDIWLVNNNINYKVQVLENVKISQIDSINNIITLEQAPWMLGFYSPSTSDPAEFSFTITGATAPSPDDFEAENPSSSNNFVAQFRGGSTFQDPIVELNGVGGGTSYTGQLNTLPTTQLKQINYSVWNTENPDDILDRNDIAFKDFGIDGYPESQNINTEGAISPIEFSASIFGDLNSVVPTLDEVRISIAYPRLQSIRKDNGDDTTNYAHYLIQIARKAPGATGFEAYKHAFTSADGTSVGIIQHAGNDNGAISFEHYIDLSIIKPFVDFKIRIFRLSRHKGVGIAQGGGDAAEAWDTDQGDSTSNISNIVAINTDKFSYPYTAHAGLFLDSREYTSVPKRSYEIRGMKVKVPSGYLPREYSTATQSKTLNGVSSPYTVPIYPDFWSGSFSTELYYTDNPVWIFLDIITNNRFGAGDWVSLSDIDIYSLYRVSKYCDELVPDGKGGFEPRFTANLYLSKATDVYKVVKDMATIFTSLVYWMDGKMSTILDAPGDPVYSFSRANVIEGTFAYESTGQKTRTNQVIVTWNNPEIGYEPTALIVEDRQNIIESGRIIKEEAVAFGCTSEGQARRYGKWKLFTAQEQTEIVSFKTSFEGLFLKPGDIIEVQDSARYGATLSGRIAEVDSSGTVITVDRPLNLNTSDSDYSYNLNVLITEPAAFYIGEDTLDLDSNGEITLGGTEYSRGKRITTNLYVYENSSYTSVEINTEARASNAFYNDSGTYRPIELSWKKDSFVESKSVSSYDNGSASGNARITVSDTFEVTPTSSSVWMLEEIYDGNQTTGSPDLYKILGIAQEENNVYSISAVEHYNSKYSFVDDPDSILDIPEDVYPVESEIIQAPTDVFILQNSNASRPNEELIVAWDYPEFDSNGIPTNRFLDSFEVLHTLPDRQNIFTVNSTNRTLSIRDVPNGTFTFRVRAISVSQKKSAWTSTKYIVDDPFDDNVSRNKGIQLEGLASQFPFITNETNSNSGLFRGDFDSALGAYDSISNDEGYRTGDIVLNTQGEYKYLPSESDGGDAEDLTTWLDHRGGIFKFRLPVSTVVAPSRFRRANSVTFSSNYTFDVNIIRSENWTGTTTGNGTRIAYVVLDKYDYGLDTFALKLINARFDEDLNIFYWYDLHEAMNEDNTTDLQKYWKELPRPSSSSSSGTVEIEAGSNKVTGTGTYFSYLNNLNKLRFSSSFAARVAYIESDTVMYLDRKAETAISSGTTAYVQKYAPEFRNDVIIGQITVGNNGRGAFNFQNFLTLDPTLRGNRDVIIDTNVAFLQYNVDEELVLAPEALNISAVALGFDSPQFKLTYGDPSTAPIDGDGNDVFAAEDTAFQDPNSGLYKYEKEIWDGLETIPYSGGNQIDIYVTVHEKDDPGDSNKSVTDSITIPRVGDVAVGEGTKSVFLELEAYDIVYNERGKNPSYTGSSDGDITLTATASNGFTDPIFRFKVAGTALIKDATTYPGAEWFDPGASNIATINFDVPTELGTSPNFTWGGVNGGSKTVVVEVAEKPENWTANVPTSGDNTNEPPENDIDAKDVDNIIAFRRGAGGISVSFTNDSHVIACDADGNVIEESNGTTLRSGGTLKVFQAGIPLNYVASGPVEGQWTITSTSTTEDYNGTQGITVGGITATTLSDETIVATIADHTFKGALGANGFETTEAITYNISIPQYGEEAATLSVVQTFSLVKNGTVGSSASLVYLYAPGPADTNSNNVPSSPSAGFPKVKVDLSTGQISTSGNDDSNPPAPVFDGEEYYDGGTSGTVWYSSLTSAASAATGNQIVYVVAATGNGTGDFDFISYNEWTNAVPFTGANGFNSAVVEIFKQTSSSTMTTDVPSGTLTYTFADGSLSTSNRNSWLTSQPSPSRSQRYIWKRTAAAISTDNEDDILDSEWSDAALVAQFVEDGITLELTNDAETVGAATSSTELNELNITTTAKVFQGGSDISSHWSFSATADTGITVTTSGNTFTVTDLSSAFQSGNVSITATANSNGNYAGAASRSVNFTVTKVANGEDGEDGVSYRITPSQAAVVYDPNSDPVSWSPTSVTFSASKITPSGSTSFTSGYWKLNNSNQGQASSVSSGTISDTSGNITAKLYLDSSYTELVDTESVPIIPQGLDADALTVTEDTSVAGEITLNFSDGTSITINDGDDGDTKGVVPIYASNSSGDNQSYTQGSLAYVNYYEYTNSKPTLPVSNLTWVKYIGEDGDNQGVIPIYADNASGTNATFTYSNQEYVNFYEWTGSAPTVVPAGLTYVKFVGDDGDDGTSVTVTSTSTSNGVTTVNFSDGTSITITDGDDGTSEGVLVVYADDSSGTNKSTTRGANQNYVLYYEWTGTKPSVSSVTGTWVLFVGDDGETQGVIPVYSSVASPTSTGQLSLTYSNQEYITFFEYTGTKPTSVTSAMVSQTYVPFVGDDGADGTAGDPGPRSVFAYIYYQSSSTSAPTIPALSTFTPNFTNGSVSSSNSNWSTNTPTFVAGNTNKYWYFTFTATESGTYNNGYPSVTKNSSPSAGSGAIQGIGFTGLVTFSSTNNIDGFNPIEWINDNGATTGTSNTTTIDGGLIRTNTIIANKLAFTPVTSVAGVTGSSISAAQLSSAGGLVLTQDLGSLASQDTVDLVNDISGNLPTTSGGTGNSYSNLTALANGIAATTAFGDLATLDSISATSSYITGLGDLATQNEANLDFIGLSSTVVQAGKITLGTSGVLFDNADSSHTVVQNAIILDTSGSANAIYIYDGNALRVKLGKL